MNRLLVALLAAVIRVAERVGIERTLRGGRIFGRLWNALRLPRTARVRAQLRLAFPEATVARRKQWQREVFEGLGQGLAEAVLMSGRHRSELLSRMDVEGLDELAAAVERSGGRGAVLVGAHLGNWELAAARLASLGLPVAAIYRGQRNAVLEQAIVTVRGGREPEAGEQSMQQIPMGRRAGIQFVRALEAGRHALVVLDQRAHRDEGLEVSFFGHPARTRFGPLKLAERAGAPVLMALPRRHPDGRGHTLTIHPPLQLESGATDDEEVLRRNLQRVTAEIEKGIRQTPGQWIWTHRRWRVPATDEAARRDPT